MPTLIKKGSVVQDDWMLLREATSPEVFEVLQGRDIILPIKFWNLYKIEMEDYSGNIPIWLDSN